VHLGQCDQVPDTVEGAVLVRQVEPAALPVGTALPELDRPRTGILEHQDVHPGQATPPAVPVVLAPFHVPDAPRTYVRESRFPQVSAGFLPDFPVQAGSIAAADSPTRSGSSSGTDRLTTASATMPSSWWRTAVPTNPTPRPSTVDT